MSPLLACILAILIGAISRLWANQGHGTEWRTQIKWSAYSGVGWCPARSSYFSGTADWRWHKHSRIQLHSPFLLPFVHTQRTRLTSSTR